VFRKSSQVFNDFVDILIGRENRMKRELGACFIHPKDQCVYHSKFFKSLTFYGKMVLGMGAILIVLMVLLSFKIWWLNN